MSRAGALWAQLGDIERAAVRAALRTAMGSEKLADCLDADRPLVPADSWPDFLIPLHQAGPQVAVPVGRCECGTEVTTELAPWVRGDGSVVWLGPKCWRERALDRARERDHPTIPLPEEE